MPRTKVTVPDLPVHFVSRPRLLALLDRAAASPVSVLSAPAGTGKTVLLTDWARRRDGDTALVALDADDRDDRRFFSAVLDALAGCRAVPADHPLRGLAVPAAPSTDAGFLAEVAAALGTLPAPVFLVLDDVGELPGARPLDALVRHRPPRLRLVLSGRGAPTVPLGGGLAELGAGDLRFTAAETRALFAVSGAPVAAGTLDRLVAETGGWAAALRIAAASAARTGDLDEFFAGHDRTLADYLDQEVLDDETREFLRRVSVCADLPPGLAVTLSGRPDAGDLLRAHALVTRGADGYRMLPLLRTYLLADLARRDPDRLADQHRLASGWFAARDDAAAALAHSVRARDGERTTALLRAHAARLFLAGEHTVLREALDVLEVGVVARTPRLALVAAALCLEAGEIGTADLHLRHAAAAWPAGPSPELAVLWQLTRARRAQLDGDDAEIARTALAVDPGLARDTDLAALAGLHREAGALLAGRRAAARDRLESLVAGAGDQRHLALRARTMLGEVAALDGDFRAMDRIAHDLDAAGAPAGAGMIETATARVLRAYRALTRADPRSCVRLLDPILTVADGPASRVGNNLALVAGTLSGAARFDAGDWHAGLRRMRHSRLSLGDRSLSPEHTALGAVLEHRAALLLGAADVAREVLTWCQDRVDGTAELLLVRARGQIALGRHASADRVLGQLLDGDVPAALPWSGIEARLLRARIALHDAEHDGARRLVTEALGVAEDLDVWWPFVFAPEEVIAVLGGLAEREPFAAALLARRRGVRTVPAPLTDRERRVLRLLPTLRSIEEIAAELTVSPNTVKTHVRGIYSKLGVTRRRDAVAVAQARGLLDGATRGG
ncbi:LuxR C-terminal-related transcriptional regulator [Amycolatopsis thermophila]|uniref:LuxR family maltose regulon positive regulatory protein n=1 Tax=Amycolatopsis thermophila TaxID=206084 RepID=A0ABU0F080_9PSEU|nr:LuxR C-terminal-related transcriptional regulator [Amycolatopsis thermophila]MDQ0380967.1 LuxR family maltose regulon positive regulatory protein [Amycolatopsis thermophila]